MPEHAPPTLEATPLSRVRLRAREALAPVPTAANDGAAPPPPRGRDALGRRDGRRDDTLAGSADAAAPSAAVARRDDVATLLPLETRGLVWTARGEPLLDGIELCLDDAGTTVLMGPNGAGKSLLLRALHGLLAPDAGTVRWNGSSPDAAVRRRQAFVFQQPVLLRRSVLANVLFVLALHERVRGGRGAGARDAVPAGVLARARDRRRARRVRALELLERLDLAHRARSPARGLSGGERQRLALGCALAGEPEVLLLDEPTASLDPASTAAIERLVVDARARGVKPILVTHDQGQARRLADDVLFLARGRVTEHTPAAEFFARPRSIEARDYLAGRLVL